MIKNSYLFRSSLDFLGLEIEASLSSDSDGRLRFSILCRHILGIFLCMINQNCSKWHNFPNDIFLLIVSMLSLTKVWYQLQGSWLAHRPRAGSGSAVETRPQPYVRVRAGNWGHYHGSIGCGVSHSEMQNLVDFCLKVNRFFGNLDIFWIGIMPTKQKFGPSLRTFFSSNDLFEKLIYRFW